MLRLDQVQKRLRDRNIKEVARLTGIAYDTVLRIASGRFKNPSYFIIEQLSDYLTKEPKDE